MSDTLQTPQDTPPADNVDTKDTQPIDDNQGADVKPTLEDMQKQLNELAEANKRLSGSISAKDKSLNALQKENSDLKKKGMDETEKAIAEAKEEKAFIVKQAHEMITESMGLDENTASLISGETGQEIRDKAEILKTYKESILKEATDKIASLEKEIETLKGNMPNPGSGNKQAGGLSDLSIGELNKLAASNPEREQEIIDEITRRNSQLKK